jgi:ElaB/YqjD/DUF883 family membrane-anchored ribosome-binding protein
MATDKDADIGDLQAEMAQLRADLAKLADTLKSVVSDEAAARYEKVREAAREAQARASKAADAVGQEIAERPFAAVAAAFGAGLVLGMLFSRR